MDNIILATDSYKLNHWNQYPKDTERVYSYFESRTGAGFPYTVFFGLQYLLKKYMAGKVVRLDDIEQAAALSKAHFGDEKLFNREGWEHIVNEHNGHLPLRIKAVAEGTVVPTNNVLMTVENTDPKCFWLTNAMESLLTHVWYPSTVATLSKNTIDIIEGYALETTDEDDELLGVPFMLHDFGYRGTSSHESAGIGGAAHLLRGRGTDTLPGMIAAMDYYGAKLDDLAFSVPATEHSVMTARGRNGEMDVVDQLLDEYPTGILSVVGDSYDIFAFVDALGEPERKAKIMARDGKFVVRPDSGDPVETMVALARKLWAIFGGTTNEKDYRVFDSHVGLLWGDGIAPRGIEEILEATQAAGFCATNFVFGMGGGLLQKINRDDLRFAFKCSAQMRGGEWIDIYKDPLDHSKASKRGRLELEHNKRGWFTTQVRVGNGYADSGANELKTVFLNGKVIKEYTFDEVRANLAA